MTAFVDVMEQFIPWSVVPNKQNLPWLTKTIIQKKRNYYFKKAHGSVDYSKLRNEVVSELRLAKQRFFSNLPLQNPNEFWTIIRPFSPRESSFPL